MYTNLFAEPVQCSLKLRLGLHRINCNKAFVTHKDLATCVAMSRFGFRSCKHGVSEENTLDPTIAQHSVISGKLLRERGCRHGTDIIVCFGQFHSEPKAHRLAIVWKVYWNQRQLVCLLAKTRFLSVISV